MMAIPNPRMTPEATRQATGIDGSGRLGRWIATELERITLEKVAEVGFANARANAALIAKGKSILALQDTPLMHGESALVIAAGPSVHRHDTARLIKESGFEGVVVATESAMSFCLRNGIIPDLVVTLDPHAHRIVRWFGDPDLTEDALTRDDYFARQDIDPKFREDQLGFNRELLNLVNTNGPRIRIAVASSASEAVVRRVVESNMDVYWWNPMYDDYDLEDSLTRQIHALNGLPCVNAGGNVGTACWVFAHAVLGKKRVGLVGVDFGYYADTSYNQTQYYKEIFALVGPDRLDEVFVRVQNPHLGQEFYTDPAYLWYREAFLEMVQQAECETYNCTGGGILFGPGIHWMVLPEFLSTCNV
ncbi:MAG: 6-hydroxymethylpterin diphosphokinase MptE-like protein [Candidatus Methylomirabilales bacterium]